MSESAIVKACLQYLQYKGYLAWRANTTGIYNPKTKGFFFHGMKGVSDILFVFPDGVIGAVECKMPRNKPTPEQNTFLDAVTSRGGFAAVVHSVEELEKDLASFAALSG